MSNPYTATDLDAEPEPIERCAHCSIELGRVAIAVTVDALPYVHLVCSETCRDTLRAQLEGV